MRVVVLGAPRGLQENRWKDDIAEAAVALGWEADHIEARGALTDDVVRLCEGADLFIWGRTHAHDPVGDAHKMLSDIERNGTPTVGIHMDLYWGVPNRIERVGNEPWWSCQYVFTADGGNQDLFESREVNHFWMPPAMGVRYYGLREAALNDRMRKLKAVFVGTHGHAVHGQHRIDLVAWGRGRYNTRFRLIGRSNKMWGIQLNHLYASTRFVLGDSAPSDRYWSDRVPITMGRGGVLAYPRTVGLEEWGFNDTNMVLFDRFNFTELQDKLDAMSDEDVANMRQAALKIVGERHLWTHRIQQIMETISA
ncbi:glycosyltransferase [Streptomyces phage Yara]|nr:glycosyltransferase [Streptomyces phage Yara]